MPPPTVADADPFDIPHVAPWVVTLDVRIGGLVIVMTEVAEHPMASDTVTVYVPALRPVAVGVVCGGLVFQL